MKTLEEIIKAIDDELIDSGKEYLLLGQANQLLVDQKLITISDKTDNLLKKLLEDGKFPHAYQTDKKPKQWRIPISDDRKRTQKKPKARVTVKKHNTPISASYQLIYCSKCFSKIIVNEKSYGKDIVKCAKCNYHTINPQFKDSSSEFRLKIKNIKLTNIQIFWLFIIIFMVILGIIGSNLDNNSYENSNYSDDASSKDFFQNTPSENNNSIALNDFTGLCFTFKSTLNDKEVNGEIVQTNHETTYHTFDFINLIVTQKSPLNGKWVKITYPMKSFYKEKGLAASTYVITVNQLGVKEIWFSPDVPNLGYDYDNGTRIACYEVTKVE